LAQRIINEVQSLARPEIQKMALEDTLRGSVEIGAKVLAKVRESKPLQTLGIEVLSLYVISIKPTPEMAKASL